MHVIQDFSLTEVPSLSKGSALTIGNFDGCHLGHQLLLQTVVSKGSSLGCSSMVLSFDPPPQEFFQKSPQLPRLFSKAMKIRAIEEQGVECLILVRFDKAMSQLTHTDFYNNLVQQKLQAKCLSLGENFHFGKGREGDIAYLTQQCKSDGIKLNVMASAKHEDVPISSSRIRDALQKGAIESANTMLGHAHLLEGVIVRGDKRGRILGFPTANLACQEQLIPASGVYSGWVYLVSDQKQHAPVMSLPERRLPAVFNVGTRPTINQSHADLRIEAHIMRQQFPLDSLYGMSAGFYLCNRLREERKFASIDELKTAIANDVQQAKNLLKI